MLAPMPRQELRMKPTVQEMNDFYKRNIVLGRGSKRRAALKTKKIKKIEKRY